MTLTENGPQATDAAIPAVVSRLRETFRAARTRPLSWRIGQLDALQRMLVDREADFVAALTADLGRGRTEAWLDDLAPIVTELKYARKHVATWVRPIRVRPSLAVQPGRAWVQPEPLGVIGIL